PSFQSVAAASTGSFICTPGTGNAVNGTGGVTFVNFVSTPQGTESLSQIAMPLAGTFSNMYIRATTNGNTATGTFKLRVNGADTSISVAVTASTTGTFSDTTHTA